MDESVIVAEALEEGRKSAAEYAEKGNALNWVVQMGLGRAVDVFNHADPWTEKYQSELATLEEEPRATCRHLPEKGNLKP